MKQENQSIASTIMKKMLVLLLALGPLSTFAANKSIIAGISDGVLLALMIAIIVLLLLILNAIAQSITSINKPNKKKESNHNSAKTLLLFALLGTGLNANAANSGEWTDFVMAESLFWILCAVIVFLAALIAYLFRTLSIMIRVYKGESFEESEASFFDTVNASLTDNVPIEEESNVMLDHEYDGIRELDNNLPPWWKYMFYATIIFAFVYITRYHITGSGKLSKAEYLAEMEAASAAKEVALAEAGEQVNEETVSYLIDEANLSKGAAIFKGNCATCHMENGAGAAGPNLTDEYWIHGGGIKNIFKTIKYGVPAKGMIAWQSQFNAAQIEQVASFVLSLQGTNPGNGIAPQGELWIPEETIEVTADSNKVESN